MRGSRELFVERNALILHEYKYFTFYENRNFRPCNKNKLINPKNIIVKFV